MKKQNLVLHRLLYTSDYRAVIKTKHARILYLELRKGSGKFTVKECYYLDRIKGGEYYAIPQKLTARVFNENEILSVVQEQLDRQYFGLEVSSKLTSLKKEDFIKHHLKSMQRKHNFLILIGDGEIIDGLPLTLKTRLSNSLHRKIYLKIRYYKDGLGVIEDCHYYDRHYKAKDKVVPQTLTSVFVEYNREAILDTINRELNCNFTDAIIADNSIDVENNTFALCGNI